MKVEQQTAKSPSQPQRQQQPIAIFKDPALFTFRAVAGWLLAFLLGGYFILNKIFAEIGIPPLYIGEVIVVLCLLASLRWFQPAFVNLFKNHFTFCCIGMFFIFGMSRCLLDFSLHGFLALRDGVIAGYAVAAFLAPLLWTNLDPTERYRHTAKKWGFVPVEMLPSFTVNLLLAFSFYALIFAGDIRFQLLKIPAPPYSIKADFFTMICAAAVWIWFLQIIKSLQAARVNRGIVVFGSTVVCLLATVLTLSLPTRAVWLSAGPVLGAFFAAHAYTPKRRKLLRIATIVALGCCAVMGFRLATSFAEWNAEFKLGQNVDFSLNHLEDDLKEKHEALPEVAILEIDSPADLGAQGERFMSLFGGGADKFQTMHGKLASEAVRFRAIFWLRCAQYTLRRLPFFGVGFGNNLTNLLRNTSAWPLFVHSQMLHPPNRTPHSAHITILTRMGLIGFGLWMAILGSVIARTLRGCWRHLSLARGATSRKLTPEQIEFHRVSFYDTLCLFGIWIIFLWAMSFGVVLESPFGGIWFWALTGILARCGREA